MSYFAAGAWWTANGQAFSTQAEADKAETSGAANTSTDAFGQAMGRTTPAAPAGAPKGPTVAQAQQQQSQATQAADAASTATNNAAYLNQRAKDQSGSLYIGDDARQKDLADQRAGVTGRDYRTNAEQQSWEDTHQRGLGGNLIRDPVTLGILAAPAAVTGLGAAIGGGAALGLGAPAAIGGGAGTGGVAGGAVGASAPFSMASPFYAGGAGAAAGAVAGAADKGLSLAQKIALGVGAAGVLGGTTIGGSGQQAPGAFTAPQVQMPQAPSYAGLDALTAPGTPGTTPGQRVQAASAQGIGGFQSAAPTSLATRAGVQTQPTQTAQRTALGSSFDMSASGGTPAGAAIPVRPSSAQSDSIMQQMLQQASAPPLQYQQGTAATSSAGTAQGFGASAGSAQGFDATAGVSQGFDAQGFAAQAGQAAQVLAATGQRDQARTLLYNTAVNLTQQAGKDAPDMYANQDEYNKSKAQTNAIIQQLLAAANMPDGPSAAEALMVNAQERAQRNAFGNAESLGGGWRSQLTGSRRQLGQAATMQADIAAQLGALRAQEYATNRDRQVTSLSNAGGLSNQIAGFDQNFGISDADRNAAIHTANQQNTRESLAAAGGLQSNMLNSDTAFSTANADREANTNIANAGFTTNANIATANNQTSASIASAQNRTSSSIANAANQTSASIASANNRTSASQTNANNQTAASIATANNQTSASQTNANNQTASSINNANNATSTSNNNAQIRAQTDQANRANTLTALQNAGVLASNTRAQDVQLSTAQANNLTQAAIAKANLQGSTYDAQVRAALANQDAALRAQALSQAQQQITNAQQKGVKIGGVQVSPEGLSALQTALGIASLVK